MDRLWSPWRAKYVKGDVMPTECLFCSKLKATTVIEDRDDLILLRGKYCFVLLNLFPYNTGHLMIAPYRHVGNVEDVSIDEFSEIKEFIDVTVKTVKDTMKPEGFNIGFNIGKVAGAGVPDHIHMHIVPRWAGDTNFMPVISNTRVLPEDLLTTYDNLLACINKWRGK